MHRAVCLLPLLMACAHRPAVVQHASDGASASLLGTWRGAMDASPVTLRVFGETDNRLHAELELSHPGGTERWVLMASVPHNDTLTFAAVDGLPMCHASVDRDRLVGSCQVEAGGRDRQWLMVRP